MTTRKEHYELKTSRDSRMYAIGIVVSAQRLLGTGARSKARTVLAMSGLDQQSLLAAANDLDIVQDEVLAEDIEQATTGDLNASGRVNGKKVTHAYYTGGGWVLYHYTGDEDYPSADEMEPLHGWPSFWPPWVSSEWLRRVGVTIL